MRQPPTPPEFFDRHTRSFVLLCCVAAAIAYMVCSWLGWDQPGRALVVLLLAELLFVSLGVLAMLFAENWFEELDATPGEWAPVARRGNPKTAFLKRPTRGAKFDRTGDYLRMVAGEMQPGTDGSYFGSAEATPRYKGGRLTLNTPASGAKSNTQPVPRSLSEALQIHRPAARSPLANFVPPPLPTAAPVAAPQAPAPAWPLFVAPAPTAPTSAPHSAPVSSPAAPVSSPAPSLASAIAAAPAFHPVTATQAPSPPPLPPAARAIPATGPGPVVTLGTPAGQGAMRPKPPRQRPS